MSQPHESLVAWKRADDLCWAVYQITKTFPGDERYGLTSQILRAAFSVPANIVEGYAFAKSATRFKFLRIAIGSLAELGYALHFAKRLGYLHERDWPQMELQLKQTAAPLHGLLSQQRRTLRSE
jgi:four helix bundle protein